MADLIQLRGGTAAQWAAANPILRIREPGYDLTNHELRVGDGTSTWSALTAVGAAMPAADILAALLPIDGPGSGLNADLLDGLTATAFQPASYRVDVRLFGAVGDGTTDDYDAIQAAIVAAEALADTGANTTIYFPPGVYYLNKFQAQNLLLTRNNSGARGWLTFEGTDAVIKLSFNVFTTFKFSRVADGDTFQKLRFRNLTFDANLTFYGLSATNVIGFGGTSPNVTRINIQDIEVSNVRTLNVVDPIGSGSGTNYTTGTVSLTNGSAVVTGSGTTWTTGNGITMDRVVYFKGDPYDPYEILSVDSATQITLRVPYRGTTASGQAHVVMLFGSAGKRSSLDFAVSESVPSGTRYNIRRIDISNVDFDGGNYGVACTGYLGAPDVNIFIDDIRIDGFRHRQRTPAWAFSADDAIHIGSWAHVGRVSISRFDIDGTGDGGIEVNQPQDCKIYDGEIRDCLATAIYLGTYSGYETQAGARCVIDNLRVKRTRDFETLSDDGRGITLFNNSGYPLGDVIIRNYKYVSTAPAQVPTQYGPICTSGSIVAERILIDGASLTYNGFNFVASDGSRRIVGIDMRCSAATKFHVKNTTFTVNGTRGGAASNLPIYGIVWGGTSPEWIVENFTYDVTMAGTVAANAHVGIDNLAAVTGGKFTIKDSTFKQTGDTGARGITVRSQIPTSQYLRLASPIYLENVDFSGLGSGTAAVNFATSTSNRDMVYGHRVRDQTSPTVPTVASAATLTLPNYGDVVGVTGTTSVTLMTPSWPGRIVALRFAGVLTMTNGNNLTFGSDFTTAATSTMTLECSREGTYTTGTIAVANAGTTVTGTGTLWVANLKPGSLIEIVGVQYLVASVASDTSLTLQTAYTGSTIASGGTYIGHQWFWRELARKT